MLKLTLRAGEYIQIADNIKVILCGGTGNNIHILVDAPKEINIARSKLLEDKESYYTDKKLPPEALKQIRKIISENKYSVSKT